MPYSNVPEGLWDKMDRCKEKVMADGGYDEPAAIAICHDAIVKGDIASVSIAGKMGFILDKETIDYSRNILGASVKAAGDWELDVLAIPFGGKDSDGQWFDANTDIMPETFTTPLAVYQHGISQGMKGVQGELEVIGKTQAGTLTKQDDGWHIRLILDKANKLAAGIMDAAKRGMVAVSSGSIAHLARLDIGGKIIGYEKNRPGRIAVWPFAEISLWEKGNGNAQPANRFAMALPAIKAIYRDANVAFPEIEISDSAQAETLRLRKQLQHSARIYLSTIEEI